MGSQTPLSRDIRFLIPAEKIQFAGPGCFTGDVPISPMARNSHSKSHQEHQIFLPGSQAS
jgi:hypothetical protein